MLFFRKKPEFTITVLPHPTICPSGEIVTANKGKSIVENLLAGDVDISHSCQMQCVCTTCHIYLIEGSDFVSPMQDDEQTELKKSNLRENWSRLACQTIFEGGGNLVVEIGNP